MRLLPIVFALAFTTSISSFAQDQQQACEWRYAGGGTAIDGSWTSADVCLTLKDAPNVRSLAQRTTRSDGSCSIRIAPGYINSGDCHNAYIVPAP